MDIYRELSSPLKFQEQLQHFNVTTLILSSYKTLKSSSLLTIYYQSLGIYLEA